MDVHAKIAAGEYNTKVPYHVEIVPVDENKMTVAGAREHKAAEKARDRAQRDLNRQDQNRLNGVFQADLEAEHGVTGHPKAGKLYSIAWEDGHSGGHSEVANVYAKLVELIQ